MARFVTVAVFTYPHEVLVPRSLLESEGIRCFVKDESTVQVYQFYSNALGGIKLQVPQEQEQDALAILKEGGYLQAPVLQPDAAEKLNAFLSGWGRTFMAVLVLVIVIVAIITYFLSRPSLGERLTSYPWVIDQVKYRNYTYRPDGGSMEPGEKIIFTDGYMAFPEISNSGISTPWKLEGNTLYTLQMDSTNAVYDIYKGPFTVELKGRQLSLKSAFTLITAHKGKKAKW